MNTNIVSIPKGTRVTFWSVPCIVTAKTDKPCSRQYASRGPSRVVCQWFGSEVTYENGATQWVSDRDLVVVRDAAGELPESDAV